LVISKYIGETEKNLSKIFDQAENKNWILFFDEADALFGKRTKVTDAHDRYANQEVSYLLQRIEDHDGVVILASNLKENMDDAFTRRFESIINFPMPDAEERFKIWKNGFSEKSTLDEDVNLEQISLNYELSGGAIMNIVRYASLAALRKGQNIITDQFIQDGIRKELEKEGRTI
jgi:SpoVK/Ycf46/Vps4 family AAA+-type ATPase